MVDSVSSAVERLGGAGVRVVVSETGWPSAGGGNTSIVDNARAYTNNLIRHVKENTGTPKCPENDLEVYTCNIPFPARPLGVGWSSQNPREHKK
ncbi:Glucan endo-1,3-beta-glucosidase, basic isoform [Platanthera zijinensis]|uniref:Glucan endo-1,3-beta-glucosidase, basic isoform n=1 Tax=Platanthera zijinensis TaxID=2320716 RepID=A0AAP0FZU9_9ASPA